MTVMAAPAPRSRRTNGVGSFLMECRSFRFLLKAGVGGGHHQRVARYEGEPRVQHLVDGVAYGHVLCRQHLAQAHQVVGKAQNVVQVRPAQIRVNQGDALLQPGQRQGQVGRHRAFADAALAPAYGKHHRGLIGSGWRPSVFRQALGARSRWGRP